MAHVSERHATHAWIQPYRPFSYCIDLSAIWTGWAIYQNLPTSRIQVSCQELQSANLIVFSSLHSISPVSFTLIYFHLKFGQVKLQKMLGKPCYWSVDQFAHAMSDLYYFCNPDSLYLPSNVGVLFVPKIFVETCKPTLFPFALSLYCFFIGFCCEGYWPYSLIALTIIGSTRKRGAWSSG